MLEIELCSIVQSKTFTQEFLQMTTPKPARPFPRKSFWTLLVLTLLIASTVMLLRVYSSELNEFVNLNPGIPNIALILAAPVGVLVWSTWLMLWARKWLIGFLVLALPLCWIGLYHPNFGGDAEIVGWVPRFWAEDAAVLKPRPDTELAQVSADLKTQTELDFPQFLGKQRDGVIRGLTISRDWGGSPPKLLWKQPVGDGWSGFSAVNGFAVTQEQQGPNECVTCYEVETGKLVWIYTAVRRHEDLVGLGKVGPRATPTIDGGRVYVVGGTGVLDCLDGSNGSLVWSVDVPERVGIERMERTNSRGLTYSTEDSTLEWGRSGSPLIFEDLVIVAAGGPRGNQGNPATLIAFDKTNGKEIWRGGDLPIAYGSPSLATIGGQTQVLLVAESFAVGHDARTGAELWRHARSGKSNADANCSQVTYLGGSKLLLSKGYNMGGEIIELQRDSSAAETGPNPSNWKAVSLKSDPRVLKTKLTNPVVKGEFVYCLSDGYLECSRWGGESETDPQKMLLRKWKQRGRFGNGQLLLIGDLLLVHSEGGELLLVEANPDRYELLGSIETVSGICWNTICVFNNRVLVRSEREAACFELPAE
jgi:outer membrane protein assembly factor BamB